MKLTTYRMGTRTVATVDIGAGARATDAASVDDLLRMPGWHDHASRSAAHGVEIDPDAEVVAPLREPRKVLCCGLNFAKHIAEMGREIPSVPTFFAKWADTLTSPCAAIEVRARDAAQLDWEAELAVVVGAHLHRAGPDECAAAIAGYTVANDISMRDHQRATTQWLQGKAFDATTPIGPTVVTPDEFDPAAHSVTCRVDGTVMQRSGLDDLIFTPADLLSHASQFTRLSPGDLVLTGTPAGVGAGRDPQVFLHDGSVVETDITGIGTLRNTIRITD